MRMQLDWNNLTVKAKDLLSVLIFFAGIVFVVATQNQKLNTIIENQEANTAIMKEYGLRLNQLELDQRLLKQQVDSYMNNNSIRQ